MSVYNPPTDVGSVFNPSNFATDDSEITTDYLNANYLKFPVAQGFETFVGTNNQATTDCQQQIDMNGNKITTCANPTAPQDVATKFYVDANIGNPNIVDTNTDAVYYPTFVAGAGSQPVLADIATTQFSINPNTSDFNVGTTLKLTQTNVAVGKNAGTTSQGANSTAIGLNAGQTTQGASSVAIGFNAGTTTQGNSSVAVGQNAGATNQATNSVAVGVNSGITTQGASSVAVGAGAGQSSQAGSSVAVGVSAGNSAQGGNAVAIGNGAGQTTQGGGGVAIGNGAGQNTQGNSAIAIGGSAGITTQGLFAVAVGGGAGATNQGQRAVAIGVNAGNGNQGARSVSIGEGAGQTSQANDCVSIGNLAGNNTQNASSIAIGFQAGLTTQGTESIAIGFRAGETQGAESVAIGKFAGTANQGAICVAIGDNAGGNGQNARSIAIGQFAGQFGQLSDAVAIGDFAGTAVQGSGAIAIGKDAGRGVPNFPITTNRQGNNAVAIGLSAGQNTQGASSVAIGENAGQTSQGVNAIAIGISAGQNTQGSNTVAVGHNSGDTSQGNNAVAIGHNAGQGTTSGQGSNSIAIGHNAGQASQTAGSICLNATGTALNPNEAGCFIDPIRNLSTVSQYNLQYNPTTKEVVSILNNNNITTEDFDTDTGSVAFIGNNITFNETGTGVSAYYSGVIEPDILTGSLYRRGLIQMNSGSNNPSATVLLTDLIYSYANISKLTFGIIPHTNENLATQGNVPAGNITQYVGLSSTASSLGNSTSNSVIWRMTSSGAGIPSWQFVINNVVQYTLTITPTHMTDKWSRAEININYGGSTTATVSGTWYNLTDGTSETTGTYTITAGTGFPNPLTTPNTIGIVMASYANNATNKYLGVDYVELQQPNLLPIGSGTTETTGR